MRPWALPFLASPASRAGPNQKASQLQLHSRILLVSPAPSVSLHPPPLQPLSLHPPQKQRHPLFQREQLPSPQLQTACSRPPRSIPPSWHPTPRSPLPSPFPVSSSPSSSAPFRSAGSSCPPTPGDGASACSQSRPPSHGSLQQSRPARSLRATSLPAPVAEQDVPPRLDGPEAASVPPSSWEAGRPSS